MRTFIAIKLPEEIKNTLAQLQEQLKTAGADVKWVNPKNIHLTLKFLGEIDENKLAGLTQILEELANEKKAFYLSISSLGAFPKISSPRVIWVGIAQGDKEIKEIVKILEERMSEIGFPKEDRIFSSHITLARVRSMLNRDRLVKDLNNLAGSFKETNKFLVPQITLFKSTLTPAGPIYETIKEFNFKKA